MDGGLGDWPEKVIKNDAGTNRLVFFSPLKERGREGETLTHTHNRYQQGHGFAVLVVGIRHLPWMHGRDMHPPRSCE